MNELNNKSNDLFDKADYYMSQTKLFVGMYLADHGLTEEMLKGMSEAKANRVRADSLAFAAQQIARMESMVKLGQRDVEAKPEQLTKRPHVDRLAHRFAFNPK